MDLGLSVGILDNAERMGLIKREFSLGTMDAEVEHPSLQLELKLPCSDPGQIDGNHMYHPSEKGPSSASPLGITTERTHWRSCDEGDGIGQAARKKLRLTKEQSCYLEQSFKEQATLNPKQKLAIARRLNLQPRQVEVWYQNRRARTKLKQTEMDFEHLKRCCESLTIENQKLQRELEELKALKSPLPQLSLHSPTAMLALCPSCERAGIPEMTGGKLGSHHIHIKHGESFRQKLAHKVG